MKDILRKLEGAPGVRAVEVMTLDGVVVAALPEGDEAERIAAFVSAVLCSIESDAETLGFESLRRLTLWAGKGRIVIVPMGQFALVIVANPDTDLTYALMEVPGLARSLMRRSRIEVES